jgi:hypothetical protein
MPSSSTGNRAGSDSSSIHHPVAQK